MIEIDEEFQNLIPPLTDDEFNQLEENCIKEGIRDSLVVWTTPSGTQLLVDGHNRYKIAQSHNLEYQIKEMEFSNRAEVKIWILENQLGRRNIDKWVKFDMTKVLEPLKKTEAKRRMSDGAKGKPISAEAKGQVRDKMAELVGVGHDTYHKMKVIDEKATPQVKEAVRQGKISTNQAYNSTFPKVLDPVREAKERHEAFQEKAKEDVVDFKDAMLDKYDQNIISHGFVRDLYRMGTAVKLFGLSHKKEEIEEQIAKLSEETIKNIIINIQTSIDELERTKKLLERRAK